jgi:hypothetical protein
MALERGIEGLEDLPYAADSQAGLDGEAAALGKAGAGDRDVRTDFGRGDWWIGVEGHGRADGGAADSPGGDKEVPGRSLGSGSSWSKGLAVEDDSSSGLVICWDRSLGVRIAQTGDDKGVGLCSYGN